MGIYRIKRKVVQWRPPWMRGDIYWTPVYPTVFDAIRCKATTTFSATYSAHYAFDYRLLKSGSWNSSGWVSATEAATNQRLHIDLNAATLVQGLRYVNAHDLGSGLTTGIKNVKIQGSNTQAAFDELSFASDVNWTDIRTGQFERQPPFDDGGNLVLFPFTENQTAYRYWAIKCYDNWGSVNYLAARHIEFLTRAPRI